MTRTDNAAEIEPMSLGGRLDVELADFAELLKSKGVPDEATELFKALFSLGLVAGANRAFEGLAEAKGGDGRAAWLAEAVVSLRERSDALVEAAESVLSGASKPGRRA